MRVGNSGCGNCGITYICDCVFLYQCSDLLVRSMVSSVTEFAKTRHNTARTEIQFIA